MAMVQCPECGSALSNLAASCPHCGIPFRVVGPPKSRGVAILLALFLGGLGIHKFYLNKPGMGVLYLVFCWTFIPAVIALLEALSYLFTSDASFQETYGGA